MAFDNFKTFTFTQVLASNDILTPDVYRKIPSVVRLGSKNRDNGGFFDYDKILDAADKNKGSNLYGDEKVIVAQDTTTKEVGIYLASSLFNEMITDYISATFSTQAASDLSSQFTSRIANATNNMAEADRYVSILTIPFEENIQPVTASFTIAETPGLATDSSGNPRQRKITYINSSSNFTNSHFFLNFRELDNSDDFGEASQEALTDSLVAAGKSHLTRSFTAHVGSPAEDIFYYIQPKPVTEWSIEMTSSNNTASFFALTSSFSGAADFGVLSGSFMGAIFEDSSINPKNYNNSDETDGSWNFVVQKGVIEGDGEYGLGEEDYIAAGGDTGTNVAFTPIQLYVWYPSYYTYANVRSASYYFTPYPTNMNELDTGAKTRDLVTGSISSSEATGNGELRTLYWLNHTYTSSFTASFGNFTRDQLKNRTGDAANHQLPYMNTSIRRFGKKGSDANVSHLWKDSALSIPADQGYYVHSASFSQASKNQMSSSLGSSNHTSSFFVMGVFKHPFAAVIDSAIINYTASQERESGVGGDTWMNQHPIASCMFLKRYDDQVFIYQPKDGQAVVSESVG